MYYIKHDFLFVDLSNQSSVKIMPGAHFNAPLVVENKAGWGPTDDTFQYKDMPYQPYSKNDQLGKV